MHITRFAPSLLLAATISCGGSDLPQDASVQRRTYSAEDRASAERVLSNARSLCGIREEAPHLVVECTAQIPAGKQLAFATAIADADATLTGSTRNIYFYLPGGQQFAQADPLHGVRLKE